MTEYVNESCSCHGVCCLKARMPALGLISYLLLSSYNENMHVESLQPANLCLVTLLSSEQCSQFQRLHLQQVHIVNKTSSFKTEFIGNNAQVSSERLTAITF